MLDFMVGFLDARLLGAMFLSYLTGGIPTGYITVKRLKGIDIREHGSGNPGAANVYRVAGPMAGVLTLLVDALKGYVAVWLARIFVPGDNRMMILCGIAAIIGHDWTVFLRFRGGKGVATSAGVFAALMPEALGCAVLIFVLGFAASGHISVGSMLAALALPFFSVAFREPLSFTLLAAGSMALILYKHVPNMKRIFAGKELRIHEPKR